MSLAEDLALLAGEGLLTASEVEAILVEGPDGPTVQSIAERIGTVPKKPLTFPPRPKIEIDLNRVRYHVHQRLMENQRIMTDDNKTPPPTPPAIVVDDSTAEEMVGNPVLKPIVLPAPVSTERHDKSFKRAIEQTPEVFTPQKTVED